MKPTFRLTTSAVALALLGAPFHPAAHAQSGAKEAARGGEVEELRREVQRLRGQVDGLRSALEEVAEADRARAAALSRAINAASGRVESAAPSLDTPPPAPTAVAAAPAPKPAARRAAAPAPAPAGVVRGKVEVPEGDEVSYVYVENVPGPVVSGQKVKIEQVRKQFVPSWAVVQRGTTIEFPNQDGIYHNVFSLSSGNSFDLGLYNSGAAAKGHRFMQPGAVDVYCNIHPQMAASVLVVPNRLFARVNANGSFELRDVPAGRRKIVAWSPRSRLVSQWIEVGAGGEAKLTLRLDGKAKGHKNKFGRPYGQYE